MPRLSYSKQELISAFNRLSKLTNNFSDIKEEILSENPKFMRVFRMLIKKSLHEMSTLTGKNYITISQYERGKIKKIPYSTSRNILKKIIPLLPKKISKKILINNYKYFKELSAGGVKQAILRAEKMELTKQEKLVKEFLIKNKIKHKEHVSFKTNVGLLNFDFIIKDRYVVECTKVTNKMKAESLGFRAIKLKEAHPNLKLVAFIPSNVNKGYINRLIDYDFIIKENKIYELLNLK